MRPGARGGNAMKTRSVSRSPQEGHAARRGQEAGVTLIEVAIALALGTVLMGVLGSVLVGTTNSLDYILKDAVSVEDMDDVVNGVRDDLRKTEIGKITIQTGSINDTLIFQERTDPEDDGTYIYGAEDNSGIFQQDWSVRYTVVGTDLVRQLLNAAGAVQSSGAVAQRVDVTAGGQKGFSVIKNGSLYTVLLTVNKAFDDQKTYSKTMQSTVLVQN